MSCHTEPRRTGVRAGAVMLLAYLIVLVTGRDAPAQQYPPPPIPPISPSHQAGEPLTPTSPMSPSQPPVQPTVPTQPPFGSDPVDEPLGTDVTANIEPDGTAAVPGTFVLGTVVPNTDGGNGTDGALPTTGLDIAVLVVWGLILVLVGRTIVKLVRSRQRWRKRDHEERQSRREAYREVPFVDTAGFVGRYAHVGARSDAS